MTACDPCAASVACATGGSSSSAWLVAAIVAAIGWAVTHFFSEAREHRKEFRAVLDRFEVSVEELRKKACAFHASPTFSEHEALELRIAIYHLVRFVNRIPLLDQRQITQFIMHVRQSITLRNYDKSEFESQPADSEIIVRISDACAGLEDECEYEYALHYPHDFPYMVPSFLTRNPLYLWVRHRRMKGRIRGG